MDNDSIVEQIVRSLSFEVEAVPQDNIIQVNTTSKSAPLNVKIRVRKKEDAGFQHGVLSLPKPDRPDGVPERIRLVSSDQTIMSFNVVMEADFEKPVRKPRKNIFGVLKPTICLGAQPDEDKYAYLPSTTYKAETNEESSSKSEGVPKKCTLQKNEGSNETSATTGPNRNKNIFGKCKPGGCLDPPFGDDRQPYLPAILNEQITTPVLVPEVTEPTVGQTAKNKTRTSSIFSHKLLNWKKKNDTHDALENNVIKKETKAESVLDLYQAGSLQTSKTYSNSIMTYPPTLNSSVHRIQEEKQRASDVYNDSSKNAYNVPSGNYFTVPKIMKNVIGENTIDIEDKGDIGNAKTDTVNTKFESKEVHDIAHSQSLVDDHKKNVLQTKDSVTDVRGTEIYFLGSIHSKESSTFVTDFESNSTPNLVSSKLHIPVLTKTEGIELDSMPFEEEQAQNIKIKVLTTPSSPAKISMTDIPAVIERTPMRAAQNIDNVTKTDRNKVIISNFIDNVQIPGEIKDKQEQIHDLTLFGEKQLPENIENDGKNIIVPSTLNDEIKNIWTHLKTDTSNKLGSPESTESEEFGNEHDLNTDASLRNRVKKSENLSTHSSIEEICDASPATEFQTDNRWTEEQNILKLTKEPVQQIGSTSNTSVGKSKTVNKSESNAPKPKYENMPQNYENKYDSKSIVTLETNQDLKDENKSVITNLGDNVSSDILVKKDTPLETIYVEGDNIQHNIWENKDSPLEKDTFIENKLNQKLDSDYKYNDTLYEVIGQEISGETLNKIEENNLQKSENLNVLPENAEFENDQRENNNLKKLQFIDSLPQSGNIEQSVLLEDNAHKMITQMNEIDSSASNLQDSLFVPKITSTLVMAESNKATDTLDVTHLVSSLQETTILTQKKAFSGNTIKDDVNVVSEVPLYNEYNEFLNTEIKLPAVDSLNKFNTYHIDDIDINELDTNKINEESEGSSLKNHEEKIENVLINYKIGNITLQGPQTYKNKDEQQLQDEMRAKKRTDQIKENNKADAKHVMIFYDEAKSDKEYDLDSTVERKNSYLERDFNMYSKADSNIYLDLKSIETNPLEMDKHVGVDKHFPVKHHSNQAQVILDRKAQFKINFAIQSYVDENNEVILKSFDANNIPKRYSNDTVRVTKCILEINDQIDIPIDSENDLSILIKCNKQKDISDVGHSLGTGITGENKMGIACKNDGNPIKRKIIIDDIQRTLLAVYEEELIPLRNTISELKDHIEMLTSQHMLLKGHALVKRSRSRRIVPLFDKCGCIRR